MKYAVDHLPAALRVIADLIGLRAALKLVAEYGGTTIWPHKTGPEAAHLAEILGEREAAALAAHFREPIYIPLAMAALRAVEHDAIRREGDELERAGMSAREAVVRLARKYKRSDRYIWALRKRADTGGAVLEAGQGELF